MDKIHFSEEDVNWLETIAKAKEIEPDLSNEIDSFAAECIEYHKIYKCKITNNVFIPSIQTMLDYIISRMEDDKKFYRTLYFDEYLHDLKELSSEINEKYKVEWIQKKLDKIVESKMLLFSERMKITKRFDVWRTSTSSLPSASCPENFICYLLSKEGREDLNRIIESKEILEDKG